MNPTRLFFIWIALFTLVEITFGLWFPFDIGLENWQDPINLDILFQLRLPRVILSWLAGAALALSGYLIQMLVRNPMADSYLLGTASGATLGATLFLSGLLPAFGLIGLVTPVFALAGALVVTILVVKLSNSLPYQNTITIVILGIAINSLTGAFSTILIYLSSETNKLRAVVFWALGSFERANWLSISILGIVVLLGLFIMFFIQSQLLVLSFGKEKANSLGLNYTKLSYIIIVLSSVLTAITVSFCGVIGFIGLMVPHIVRSYTEADKPVHPFMLATVGGSMLLAADIMAKVLYPPAGLPVGAVTSLLGAPFFLYLLRRKYKREY